MAPKLVPRVDVIHVAPSPIPLASNKTRIEMKTSFTSEPRNHQTNGQFLRDALLPGAAEAMLSGTASDVVDGTGLANGGLSPSDFAASSIAFSTCTRISAPRRVSTGGAAAPESAARAFADCAEADSGCLGGVFTPGISLTSTPWCATTMMSCQVCAGNEPPVMRLVGE